MQFYSYNLNLTTTLTCATIERYSFLTNKPKNIHLFR